MAREAGSTTTPASVPRPSPKRHRAYPRAGGERSPCDVQNCTHIGSAPQRRGTPITIDSELAGRPAPKALQPADEERSHRGIARDLGQPGIPSAASSSGTGKPDDGAAGGRDVWRFILHAAAIDPHLHDLRHCRIINPMNLYVTRTYERVIRKLISEDDRREMEAAIAAAPDAAPVIRGTGGIRKLRWAGSGRASAAASAPSISGMSARRRSTC